jgi:phosphoserine aminotransferase
MNDNKTNKLGFFLLAFLLCLSPGHAMAKPKIAVLDFELKDLTLKPGVPQELERTASVKPMLEEELKKSGYEIVTIPADAQVGATAGVGYLFDHHDTAAKLAQKYGADYVIVGRLHKPSFLFVYLMAHLVDVKQERLIADYSSEVKGSEKKLTRKGVESLVVKVNETFGGLK